MKQEDKHSCRLVIKGHKCPSWVSLSERLTFDWNNKIGDTFKHFQLIQGDSRRKYWAKLIHKTERIFATGGVAASSARVDIYGTYKGKSVHWVYSTPSITMGELTGFTAAIAAQLYAEGKIAGSGIIPPEALSEDAPSLFFDELKKRDIDMIFDENEPLKHFKPPEPFTPSFITSYGLTISILVIIVVILLGTFWFLLSVL